MEAIHTAHTPQQTGARHFVARLFFAIALLLEGQRPSDYWGHMRTRGLNVTHLAGEEVRDYGRMASSVRIARNHVSEIDSEALKLHILSDLKRSSGARALTRIWATDRPDEWRSAHTLNLQKAAAHLLHIDGAWQGLELGGGQTESWTPGVAKVLGENAQSMREALDLLHRPTPPSNQELFQRWQDGKPVVIVSGPEGHAVLFLIWNDQIIKGNRGEGGNDKGIVFAHFDRSKMNPQVIAEIRHNTRSPKSWKAFKSRITSQLGIAPTEEDLEMQKASPIGLQTADNCSWASLEAILYGAEQVGLIESFEEVVERYRDDLMNQLREDAQTTPLPHASGFVELAQSKLN